MLFHHQTLPAVRSLGQGWALRLAAATLRQRPAVPAVLLLLRLLLALGQGRAFPIRMAVALLRLRGVLLALLSHMLPEGEEEDLQGHGPDLLSPSDVSSLDSVSSLLFLQ